MNPRSSSVVLASSAAEAGQVALGQPTANLASLESLAKQLWPAKEIIRKADGRLLVKIDLEDFPTNLTWSEITKRNCAVEPVVRNFPLNYAVPILVETLIPDEEIFRQATLLRVGAFYTSNNLIHASNLAAPLKLVHYNALYVDRPVQYQSGLEEFAKKLNPRQSESAARFIPFIGSFFLNGQELPLAVLQKLNLHPLSFSRENGGLALGSGMQEVVKLPMFEYSLRGAELPLFGKIMLEPNLKGGYTIVDPGQAQASTSSIAVSVCATQWIGCGTSKYVYHAHNYASNEPLPGPHCLEFDLQISGQEESLRLFQDVRYAEKAGIFLDTKFQSGFFSTPVGGFAKPGVALTRDRLLLENGAILSGLTIAEYPLFSKQELDQVLGYDSGMVCEQLCIQQRVILDDTRRLSVLAKGPEGISAAILKSLSTEDSSDPHLIAINHFLKLADTIGKNISVCLKLGLTTLPDQDTLNNLSVRGGMIDPESLIEAKSFFELAVLPISWLNDIFLAAKFNQVSVPELLEAGFFENLYGGLFKEHPQILEARLRSFEQIKFAIPELVICSIVTDALNLELLRQRRYFHLGDLVGLALSSNLKQSQWMTQSLSVDQIEMLPFLAQLLKQIEDPRLYNELFNSSEFRELRHSLQYNYIDGMVVKCGVGMFSSAEVRSVQDLPILEPQSKTLNV